MRTPLSIPTIIVFELPAGRLHNDGTSVKPGRWRQKPTPSSYHFGMTSALASARARHREGIPVWIEKNGARATRLTESRSPALRDRLRSKGRIP